MRERHLDDGGGEPSVRNVVTRGDESLVHAKLSRLPSLLKVGAVVHVRACVAHLVERLREGATAEPALGLRAAEFDEHELADAGELEIGRDRLGDVRDGYVTRHHDGPGSLDNLAAGARRHGQRILPAVDRDVKLAHRRAQGFARVEHVRAVTRQLRCVHPVARVLDILQTRGVCEDEVGE